ncbi:MAG: BrnT family toxin [Acidobacteria bacterium]|nr:BrnT family toxin [Acidobacteriota bacterium]
MADLRFTWDPAKARANVTKHGVSFAEAQTVFLDDRARVIDDPEHSCDEARFVLLGVSIRLRVLVVVHAYREAAGIIRIISARRATPRERRQYVQGDE